MKTIMIADDSPSMRQLVSSTLSGAGYRVVETKDGVEALKKSGDGGHSLIITDVNMPGMDGIKLIQALKQQAATRHVPIIVLTTETHSALKEQARQAGAKAWLVKPFQPPQLLDAVKRVLAA